MPRGSPKSSGLGSVSPRHRRPVDLIDCGAAGTSTARRRDPVRLPTRDRGGRPLCSPQSHFGYGQLDLVILLMCCLFVRAQLRDQTARRPVIRGGIAQPRRACWWSTLARRKVRVLLATGVWILVWAVLLPTLVSAKAVAFYRGWWLEGLRHHLESPVGIEWRTRFTLAGMLVRLWPEVQEVSRALTGWPADADLTLVAARRARSHHLMPSRRISRPFRSCRPLAKCTI